MTDDRRFDRKAFAGHLIIALVVGGGFAYFTDAKWAAASFWVSAAMYLNGSIAEFEDARPGGVNNLDGTDAPNFAKGWGATKYALTSFIIVAALAVAGLVFQKYL